MFFIEVACFASFLYTPVVLAAGEKEAEAKGKIKETVVSGNKLDRNGYTFQIGVKGRKQCR